MRRVLTLAFTVLVIGAFAARAASFPDAREKPPAGWTGPVFKLSQDYPSKPPAAEEQPWKQYDFKTQPEQYIRAVLAYGIEGNNESDWRGYDNATRKWYHAPWMHYGNNGREFIRGLTRERNSRPRELAPEQTCYWQNWAVGFYNPAGGWVVGQVWKDPMRPDATKSGFPEGTVSIKLLFTAAPESQVPYLKNGFQWQGNIDPLGVACNAIDPPGVRTPATVTLLQIDVAVRDSRADATTGWVMGTFVYDGNSAGATAWDRMVPVGVQWGNDPELTPARHAAGERVKESWINPALQIPQHLGWLGRLNGPVDNPISACLSCHGAGQDPAVRQTFPPPGSTDEERMHWFRNIKTGETFNPGSPQDPAKSLHYSLQLALGIQNFRTDQQQIVPAVSNGEVVMKMAKAQEEVFPISREEGMGEADMMAAAHGASEAGEAGSAPAASPATSGAPPPAGEEKRPWLPIAAGVIGFLLGLGVMAAMRRSG